MITTVIASGFIRVPRDRHDVNDAVFFIDGDLSLQCACDRHGLEFRYECHGDRNSDEYIIRNIKKQITSFSNFFRTTGSTTID